MAPDIGRVTLLLRRILTVTLVVALVTMGVPIPGYASGGQEQTLKNDQVNAVALDNDGQPVTDNAAQRKNVLTLGGRPIWQIASTTGRTGAAFSFAEMTPGELGTLRARQPTTTTSDPLWNGIAIGAGVGALTGLAVGAAFCEGSAGIHCESGRVQGQAAVGYAVIGAGIGALVDFLR